MTLEDLSLEDQLDQQKVWREFIDRKIEKLEKQIEDRDNGN